MWGDVVHNTDTPNIANALNNMGVAENRGP